MDAQCLDRYNQTQSNEQHWSEKRGIQKQFNVLKTVQETTQKRYLPAEIKNNIAELMRNYMNASDAERLFIDRIVVAVTNQFSRITFHDLLYDIFTSTHREEFITEYGIHSTHLKTDDNETFDDFSVESFILPQPKDLQKSNNQSMTTQKIDSHKQTQPMNLQKSNNQSMIVLKVAYGSKDILTKKKICETLTSSSSATKNESSNLPERRKSVPSLNSSSLLESNSLSESSDRRESTTSININDSKESVEPDHPKNVNMPSCYIFLPYYLIVLY